MHMHSTTAETLKRWTTSNCWSNKQHYVQSYLCKSAAIRRQIKQLAEVHMTTQFAQTWTDLFKALEMKCQYSWWSIDQHLLCSASLHPACVQKPPRQVTTFSSYSLIHTAETASTPSISINTTVLLVYRDVNPSSCESQKANWAYHFSLFTVSNNGA